MNEDRLRKFLSANPPIPPENPTERLMKVLGVKDGGGGDKPTEHKLRTPDHISTKPGEKQPTIAPKIILKPKL